MSRLATDWKTGRSNAIIHLTLSEKICIVYVKGSCIQYLVAIVYSFQPVTIERMTRQTEGEGQGYKRDSRRTTIYYILYYTVMKDNTTIVNPQLNTIEIFDNDLDYWLKDYCEKYNFDLKKETQNIFHGCMKYIYIHTFLIDNSTLKIKPIYPVSNSINNLKTSYGAYDINKLYELLLWYEFTADTYDKAITLAGYSKLSGVGRSTIYGWRETETYNDDRYTGKAATSSRSDFVKKLRELEEDSLTAIGITGKRNVVGTLEALNYSYGHNMPGVSREVGHNALNLDNKALITRLSGHMIESGSDSAE